MDCNRTNEYIDMYADDMLSDAEKAELMRHVDSCAQCKKDLDDTLTLKSALGGLGGMTPPAGLAASAISKAKKKSRVPTIAFITAGAAAVAVAVVVLVTGVGGGLQRAQEVPMAYDAPAEDALEERAAEEPVGNSFKMEADLAAAEAPMEEAEMAPAPEAMAEPAAEEPAEAAMEAEQDAAMADDGAVMADEPAMEEEAAAEAPAADTAGGEMRAWSTIVLWPEQTAQIDAAEAFIESAGDSAERVEYEFETIVTVTLNEEILADLETLIVENELEWEGELSPDGVIDFVFVNE